MRRPRLPPRCDVFLTFPQADLGALAGAAGLEQELREHGLTVRFDDDPDGPDVVTAATAEALAGAHLLLAVHSRSRPLSGPRQWALITTFLAASGGGSRRVLALSADGDVAHLVPAELAQCVVPMPGSAAELARVVRERWPGESPATDQFAGRHEVFWSIHKALCGARFAVGEAPATPAAVICGAPGSGKTATAERYATLFRDAYPGGTVRTGPFGHLDPGDFLSLFHLTLSATLSRRFAVDTTGLTLPQLRRLAAERIDEPTLVLVDDVPAGLPPAVLDQIVLPTARVATLVTARVAQPAWAAPAIGLAGLAPSDGLRLFDGIRPLRADERDAVRGLVDRCDGHPFAIRANAHLLRGRSGTLDAEVLAARPSTAPQAILDLIGELPAVARRLVLLGTVLAPVPIPTGFAAEALGLSTDAVTAAAGELVARGLARPDPGCLRLHTLVLEVARSAFPHAEPDALVTGAALRLPADDPRHRVLLLQHARALAERTTGPRAALLRPVAAAYSALGDHAAAGEVRAAILAGNATAADYADAARVEIDCGLYAQAVRHARHAMAAAADETVRYEAGLTAAEALDCQGDYAAADEVFWRHDAIRWPRGPEQRLRAITALARARRFRGRPDRALPLFDGAHGLRADADRTAAMELEHARNLLLMGRSRPARDLAADVAGAYRRRGRHHHSGHAEALLLWADTALALDMEHLRTPDEPAVLRDLTAKYREQEGAGSPLTLAASVPLARALIAAGRAEEALEVLSGTETVLLGEFGDDNPLRYRVRHAIASSHGRLGDFGRQARVLDDIVAGQGRLLGLRHPETLATRLDLGTALALADPASRNHATRIVDEAAADVRRTFRAPRALSAKASAARAAVRTR
ncbi:YbbN family protein [Amycolatopsis thermoflava]|uniref:TIR domain-containing protein n=1 Tax=Amycolatopsis thermoflava TaxID=84480 RepID=A0A3N2GQC5_9PSEU|nr:hypothetical protein [Amycolatopsis thermoflava]ROS38822.1 hypothetical protein EDD35_1110 [Amycolatopsis thermoflava]